MRGFLITSAVLSLSLYAPSAQAQESEPLGGTRVQATPPPQSEIWVYCLVLEEGHPEEGVCGEWFEQLTVAERLDFQEWRAEEDAGNWDSIVEQYSLIAVERRGEVTDPITGKRVLYTSVVAVLGGVFGAPTGFFLIAGGCELVGGGDAYLGCFPAGILGGLVGVVAGLGIGGIKGWRESSGGGTQVSFNPYRYDDASGLMFSGQF